MNYARQLVLVTAILFMFFAVGHATPVLFDQLPVNNSYFGRGYVYFFVNITSSSLDTNSVVLSIISEDASLHNETWDNYTMQCSQYAVDNWICTRSVSFSIASSDTLEFFYFTAKDTDYGYLGTQTNPLVFKIDRSPPDITFIAPKNYTYVSGYALLNITAADNVSGVNISSAQFSVEGSAWSAMGNLTSYINTTPYANNQTISVKVRVGDNVSNVGTGEVNVTVDNEIPLLSVIAPVRDDILNDNKLFSVNVSDRFSGINSTSGVHYEINQSYPLLCSGNSCTDTVDTKKFSDGEYNITFIVYDRAGNINSSIVPVIFRNSRPSLTISPKSYVKENITFTASIARPGGIITAVTLNLNGPQSLSVMMSCNSGFTQCTYPLNTNTLPDGIYNITATASNVLSYSVTDTGTLIIDNTNPQITLDGANFTKAILTINARINDANGDTGKVTYASVGASQYMSCLEQSSILYCTGQYDFSSLADNHYNLTVTAVDKLGHTSTKSKTVYVDKNPPEFRSLKITPLNPSSPTNVSLQAEIIDQGSAVKAVSFSVTNPTFSLNTYLVNISGNWTRTFRATSVGAYQVDLTATDENDNSITFGNVGYFYLGQLSCGDGVCQSNENYCLCQMDCYAPTCTTGTVNCGSGIPSCPLGSGSVSRRNTTNTSSNTPVTTTVPGKNVPDANKTGQVAGNNQGFADVLSIINPLPVGIIIVIVIAALLIFKFRKSFKKKEKAETFFSH